MKTVELTAEIFGKPKYDFNEHVHGSSTLMYMLYI